MPPSSSQIETILAAAVELPTPEARQEYLAQACAGDPELLRQVEQMLEFHFQAGSFLQSPAPGLPSTISMPMEMAGQKIGPYKLLEKLGEGGMGTVWVAEREKPIRQRVALKLIKPGMDSVTVLRRFDAERQALALMSHNNIAKMLDAGSAPLIPVGREGRGKDPSPLSPPGRGAGGEGAQVLPLAKGELEGVLYPRPYFVMELVKGVPITKYCDETHATIEERLRLFIPVCQAVQHAHQKGIIHRDIKPSNVLVCIEDGKPVPKVIDFGVAKALHQPLTDGTLHTGFNQIVGTLEYMSPEQAELNALDIDTRADVYALGVLLFELLTGSTPVTRDELRQVALVGMLRQLKEVEPRKPSTRLSESKETIASLAAMRRTDPKMLMKEVRGDLDWIVLKCLEADRTRRYETTNALVRDVERHLANEAVEARPPSAVYRLRKAARKYRRGLLTAGVIAAVLVACTGISVWQATEAISQRNDKSRALDLAKEAKHTAELREAETMTVLEFLENHILAAARPEGLEGGLGHEVQLRKALETALPFVATSFPNQPVIEARLRRTLGLSFKHLGDHKLALEQFEAARLLYAKHRGSDHPDTLATMNNLANTYAALGRQDDALKLRKETLALRKAKLDPAHQDTLASMSNLAQSYDALGQYEDALRLREETLKLQKAWLGVDDTNTLASMNNLGISYTLLGRHVEAVKLRKETLMLMQDRFGPKHANTLACKNNLAESYQAIGRLADALKLYEETLSQAYSTLSPDHPGTLLVMNNIAWLLATAEDKRFRDPARALTLATKAAHSSPKSADFWGTLGVARCRISDWKTAILDLEKAIGLRSPTDSVNANESFFLAMACWQLGDKPAAHTWFKKGAAWMDGGKSRYDEVRRFRAKAAALLGIKEEIQRSD